MLQSYRGVECGMAAHVIRLFLFPGVIIKEYSMSLQTLTVERGKEGEARGESIYFRSISFFPFIS